jgi:hypothetical protein
VVGQVLANDEIFWPIVIPDPISMMDNRRERQEFSKDFLNNKNLLWDITFFVSPGVAEDHTLHITFRMDSKPPFPFCLVIMDKSDGVAPNPAALAIGLRGYRCGLTATALTETVSH